MRQKLTTYTDDPDYKVEKIANLDHFPHVKGYDFSKKFNFKKFIESYYTTGFQATNVGRAIDIIKQMRANKVDIYLSCTSNMISSGNREIVKYLIENKWIKALIITAGGIEEDVIKTMKPFVIGDFRSSGKLLFNEGVNRIGNIFVTNDRYTDFEKFMVPFLKEIAKEDKVYGVTELLYKLGERIENEESVLYWASKNNIPVFCPALTDGAFGDMIFFQKQRDKNFKIDICEDMNKIVTMVVNANETGVICLGGGAAKHYLLNAQIFKEGAEYAVYVNTGQEYDGSDSGARIDEAISWGKIKPNAKEIKVHGDATIIFPLIMAGVLES